MTFFLPSEGRRSFNIEDLTGIDLSFLDLIVEEIANHELKARIADILWIRNKNHKRAKIALKSFLKSGSNFLKNGTGVLSGNQFLNRLSRSIQIALSIKDKQHHLSLIARYARCLIKETSNKNIKEKDYLIFCFLKILSETKIDDQLCSEFIEQYLSQTTNIHDKNRICEIGIETAKRLKQIDKVNDFYRIQAKAKFEEAKRFETENNYIGANSYLKEALEILKNVNPLLESDKILRTQWQNLLTEVNAKVCENMQKISVSIDATDLIKECNEKLEKIKKYKSSLPDTLYIFTGNDFRKFDEAFREAEESLNSSVFRKIFQTTSFDKDSKEIKSSNQIKDEAIKNLQIHWGLSKEFIEMVRKYIIENFKTDDLVGVISAIIDNNPLVLESRKNQIFKGIFSGFYADWIVSSHLIPAQIEEILRKRLREKGKYQLKTKDNQTQQEKDINELLSDGEYRNFLNDDEYLSLDLLFNLEAILIHKYGQNLRNDCYHGLCDDEFYDRPSNIYLWWIFLKMLIDAKCKSQEIETK